MKVTIAPDFESLLPRHTREELKQLEANILADPNHERFPAVMLWSNHDNTILDGHNQYKIRSKHGLKIKFAKMEFETRDEALAFAMQAQLGRRNLDPSTTAMVLSKLPKNPRGGDRKSDQLDNCPVDRETIAAQHGVSSKSVQRADKVRANAAPEVVAAVESGQVAVSDAAAVADLPKPVQKEAVKAVKSGKAKTLKQAAEESAPVPDADSLPAVQADLREFESKLREVARFGRKVLGAEGNDITRPWCGRYTILALIHPIQQVARTIINDLPVAGKPDDPVLHHEQIARSAK